MKTSKRLRLGPIIGGLGPEQVNLWGKAEPVDTLISTQDVRLQAWIGNKPDLSDAKLAGNSLPLTQDSGFAGVVPLSGLKPGTKYFYALGLDAQHPQQPDGHFTTFPPEGTTASFSFAFGSCYLRKGADSGRAFRILNQYCQGTEGQADQPRFILMIGDQIYADAYPFNGLNKVATTLEDYRAVYDHTWADPDHRALLAALPAYMTLDDHEVDDDWAWWDEKRSRAYNSVFERILRLLKGRPFDERIIQPKRVRAALRACWEHQFMHGSGFTQMLELNDEWNYTLHDRDPGSLAYKFNFGTTAFFVMDTRTCRIRDLRDKHMLGEGQKENLKQWLLSVKDSHPVKFLVTSSAFLLELWVDITRDRWVGYKSERNEILRFIAENDIGGVHFIAGDLHSAHALSIDLKSASGRPLQIWEYCASPFQQGTNWLAPWTYRKIRSPQIIPGSQSLSFIIPRINFGIVRVDHENGPARVSLDLHYEDEQGKWLVYPAGG